MLASSLCSQAEGLLLADAALRRGRGATARSLVVLPSPAVAVPVVVWLPAPVPTAVPPPVITLTPRRPAPAAHPVRLPATSSTTAAAVVVMVVVMPVPVVSVSVPVPVPVVLPLLTLPVTLPVAVNTLGAARRLAAVAAVVRPTRQGPMGSEGRLCSRPGHGHTTAAELTHRWRLHVGPMPVVACHAGGGALRRRKVADS